eukprot:CAMPEP_0185769992 /NCGR_PEP_ID=MMETSP1174-20130828/56966_1 /TAXON_ID=35687 /ORGANISM="Dictyocha speculum, Strain CCMP1381" /LENGTH=344 /DNA_ID=CAMNT_0028455265 /DNA_START=31 /DNA_END=1065 /DNA_ORIENTATION=-
MRPILLKGHERSITCVKFSADGDLIFTAAKDLVPTLWYADSGERMGTYNGHLGAVWDLDPSWDVRLLVTGAADQSAKLWDIETGEELQDYHHPGPVRSVCFDDAAQRIVTCSDKFSEKPAVISIFEVNTEDPRKSRNTPLQQFEIPNGTPKATRVAFVHYDGKLDSAILVAYEDGNVALLDCDTGDVIIEEMLHEAQINRLSLNKDKTLLFTASADCKAKMIDVANLEVLHTYSTDRPVNAIVPHPSKDHVLLGGGQEAMSVTTTSGRVGKFECRFFEMIHGEEFARVKGHFGPINVIAINPNGRSYASGAEDGYIRLHHFDQDYIEMQDPVPEDIKPPYQEEA